MTEEERKPFLVRHWKGLLNSIIVLALIALVVAMHNQLVQTFQNLSHVSVYYLILLLPIEFLNYDAQARFYRSMYQVLGDKLKYWFGFKLSLELNFINLVFPSGGVSGISYFGVRLKSAGLGGSRAVLVQILKMFLTWISFELLLIIGLFILATNGHAGNLVILFAGALSTLVIVGTFLFIFIVSSRTRISAVTVFIVQILNWLLDIIHLRNLHINIDRFHVALDELHESYKKIESRLTKLQRPFWQALYMNATEVAALYVVFIAFGHFVNIGAIILAYAIANFAGLISVLPGGAVVYEGLMTAVLVIAGVPVAISLPVVVMYRILNTLIQVPPGYYFYHRGLRT